MMKQHTSDALAQFPIDVAQFTPMETRGFSGAMLWEVISTQGDRYCLKCYGAGNVSPEHLQWTHRVLAHAAINQCDFVVLPRRSNDPEKRFANHANHFWELAPWADGQQVIESSQGAAVIDQPLSDAQIQNAFTSVARFHQAAAQVDFDFRPSPNIPRRLKGLDEYRQTLDQAASTQALTPTAQAVAGELNELRLAASYVPPSLVDRVKSAAQAYLKQTLPIQPVIRDLRAEHLFFDGDRLVGLIDFDAMQMDCVAYDLARLVATMGLNQAQASMAIEAYVEVRKLRGDEHGLVLLLGMISRLLVPLQWIEWLLVEGRTFENADAVRERLIWARADLANL